MGLGVFVSSKGDATRGIFLNVEIIWKINIKLNNDD